MKAMSDTLSQELSLSSETRESALYLIELTCRFKSLCVVRYRLLFVLYAITFSLCCTLLPSLLPMWIANTQINDFPYFFKMIYSPQCLQSKKFVATKSVFFLSLNPSRPQRRSSLS
ncbi:hypothetical protein ACSBR1_040351 [Camellia fascicularis]